MISSASSSFTAPNSMWRTVKGCSRWFCLFCIWKMGRNLIWLVSMHFSSDLSDFSFRTTCTRSITAVPMSYPISSAHYTLQTYCWLTRIESCTHTYSVKKFKSKRMLHLGSPHCSRELSISRCCMSYGKYFYSSGTNTLFFIFQSRW